MVKRKSMDCELEAIVLVCVYGLPWWLSGNESACQCRRQCPGSIPGSGRSLGEGNGNPLQYSCLENSMGRGAWRATVHGATESWKMTK